MNYKIDFNRDECLGCGACTSCDNWEFASDGRVNPLETEFNDIGCNSVASEICPVQIIKITKNLYK